MKKDSKQRSLAVSVSFAFLLLVVVGYFWLWRISQPSSSSDVVLEDKYSTVEISSVKQQAQELIQSKGNLVEMPISAPTENVGKADPFAGI